MNISIILLTYNSIKFVDKFLESIFEQSYKNFEVIIIDNFSNDGTYEKLKKMNLKNTKLIQFKNNGNMAASRNIGIKNAKYDFLAFHDSDDFWFKNKLKVCVSYLDKFDFIYHNCNIIQENSLKKLRPVNRYQISNKIKGQMLLKGNPIATSSVIVKKKINDDLIQFDEKKKLMAIEDFDLWLKLNFNGFKFKYIEQNLGYILERKGSESKVKLNKIHGYKIILNKYKNFLSKEDLLKANIYQKYLFANILYYLNKKNIEFLLACYF